MAYEKIRLNFMIKMACEGIFVKKYIMNKMFVYYKQSLMINVLISKTNNNKCIKERFYFIWLLILNTSYMKPRGSCGVD
jgi:hypothetical protein